MSNYHPLIKAIEYRIEEVKYYLLNHVESMEDYKFHSGKLTGLYTARNILTEHLTKSDDND